MRIKRISIQDVFGTESISFEPGTVTVLEGKNSSGKSSVINAVATIFSGGSDSEWLRKGAQSGHVTLELDTGTIIKKRITQKGSTLEITDPEGNKVPSPMSFVKELGDILAVDPLRLLNAPEKELVSILQTLLPLRFAETELRQAIGEDALKRLNSEAPKITQVDLDGFLALREWIYERRKKANTLARDSEGTVAQLRKTLPSEDDSFDWQAELTAVDSDIKELHGEINKNLEQIHSTMMAEVAAFQGLRDDRIATARREYESILASIQMEYAAATEDCNRKAQESKDAVRAQASEFENQLAERRAKAAQAVKNRESINIVQQQIAGAEEKARVNNGLSMVLTSGLEAMDELKRRKMAELPIPDLMIVDGKITYKGVVWRQVNLARRVELLIQICSMRAGKLGLLIVDDSEHMDPDTFQAFVEGAKEAEYQVIAARVSDGPLAITKV